MKEQGQSWDSPEGLFQCVMAIAIRESLPPRVIETIALAICSPSTSPCVGDAAAPCASCEPSPTLTDDIAAELYGARAPPRPPPPGQAQLFGA